jgi:hypothetical protein
MLKALPKRLVLVVVVIILAVVAGYLLWQQAHTHTYTVTAYQFPTCTTDVPPSSCGDATITVKTSSGETKKFHYNGLKPPKIEGADKGTFIFSEGSKVQITTGLNGDVTKVKLLN